MKTILITGVSSGIGKALAMEYLHLGYRVYGIGRNECKPIMSSPNFNFFPLDLQDSDLVRDNIRDFVVGRHFNYAILNAGTYFETKDIINITLDEMRGIMDINLWSNKQVIDALLAHSNIDQIVALSANLSLFTHKGFGGYAVSKAALNMMIEIYAKEFPHVHFSTLAPDLIQTPTLSALLKESDPERFPVIQKIRDSLILPVDQAVSKLTDAIQEIRKLKSGSFVELKKLNRPEMIARGL